MSSKNRNNKSIEYDRFYTPPWCVNQFANIVVPTIMQKFLRDGKDSQFSVLEPSAGGGAFLEPRLWDKWVTTVHAMDLDTMAGPWPDADRSTYGDYLDFANELPEVPTKPEFKELNVHYDLVCGNPPFGLAYEFVKASLNVGWNVAFLLRLGFLASEDRREFLIENPPSHVFSLAHRPSFTRDRKTDSADYAFVCWSKTWDKPTELHFLPIVSLAERKISAYGVLAYEDGKERSLTHPRLFA